ncbi:Flp family type IVb pilin [Billgrantia sp. C5P2]|uniref:Flp family type IVb pilin n=1 Tax=Billgrantia sp. C5P2 TaxID=3436239 RepID=UPI003DA6BA25
MSKLMQGIERFWREEQGTEVVEWALVGGLIVAAGAGIYLVIGERVAELMEELRLAIGAAEPA